MSHAGDGRRGGDGREHSGDEDGGGDVHEYGGRPYPGARDVAEGIRRMMTVSYDALGEMIATGAVTDAFTIAAYTRARLAGLLATPARARAGRLTADAYGALRRTRGEGTGVAPARRGRRASAGTRVRRTGPSARVRPALTSLKST